MAQTQQSTNTYQNFTEDLDAKLYASLASLSGLPYPLQFHRVGSIVTLQEGPYTSTILERQGYSKDASWFSFQLSFVNNGIENAGWFLYSKANFFLVYSLVRVDIPTALRALLIPRLRLCQDLEYRGFNRSILAGRADLIRRGGRGGLFRTADPDISFSFRTEGERRPVEVRVQTPALEKIAVGDFMVPIGNSAEALTGKWLGQRI